MAVHFHVGGRRGWVYAFKEDADAEAAKSGRKIKRCDRGIESICGMWAALERMVTYDPDWPDPLLTDNTEAKKKKPQKRKRG